MFLYYRNYFFFGSELIAVRTLLASLLCTTPKSLDVLRRNGCETSASVVVCDQCFDDWTEIAPPHFSSPSLKMPPRCYHLPVGGTS